ncbi:class A beta-lactamase [Bradyrhizobium sp. AUGA SZCCT0169]|uniref:class A beta-lactamase n=1 Tax=Bradyrhizobium sp. AUGA SZCCT0169 TaxID=2807663 RepID=UPI001BA79D97|nr:class A beta-lactamase [Bradyrhizobium sp. AUGA SZCCT0169]MBR1250775.1 class A beta-lactamase [Bradyrhizobium sp. AUGA SZCCT0169]
MISRRQFHLGFGAALIAADLGGLPKAARAAAADQRLIAEIKRLESESGGRLGVCVLETATGARHVHRGDERFPMCSTFKALAAAAVLARVDAGKEQLTRRITFDASAIVVYSPVTEKHVGGDGMTLAEICDAAMTRSDNTAGNLLLASIGGPPGLTAFARGLGDQVTRLDRDEPSLNQALPDDPRDTTTPNAMASNFEKLVLGTGALSAASREQLTAWLVANKTGETRLRAGFAKGWRVGDKTGAGDHGTNNDVAVVWPPDGAPIIVAAYLTGANVPSAQQNATIASIARAVATMRSG